MSVFDRQAADQCDSVGNLLACGLEHLGALGYRVDVAEFTFTLEAQQA
jgi:hypothetical protein